LFPNQIAITSLARPAHVTRWGGLLAVLLADAAVGLAKRNAFAGDQRIRFFGGVDRGVEFDLVGAETHAIDSYGHDGGGRQRDLQLIKPPLFRGIDVALATAAIMTVGIDGVRFRADQIKLDPAIHAAEEANALVAREGIPFREAYRRIGEKYRK
jgi:hypothetical protein